MTASYRHMEATAKIIFKDNMSVEFEDDILHVEDYINYKDSCRFCSRRFKDEEFIHKVEIRFGCCPSGCHYETFWTCASCLKKFIKVLEYVKIETQLIESKKAMRLAINEFKKRLKGGL